MKDLPNSILYLIKQLYENVNPCFSLLSGSLKLLGSIGAEKPLFISWVMSGERKWLKYCISYIARLSFLPSCSLYSEEEREVFPSGKPCRSLD